MNVSSRPRLWMLGCCALAVLGGTLAPPVARASITVVGLSVDRQRLMSAADVPRVLGRFSPESVSHPVDPGMTVCRNASGEINVPTSARQVTVTVHSVPGARLYRSVSEDVYRYSDEQAATRAFTSLAQAATPCTGTTSRRDAEAGYTEQVTLATGTVSGSTSIWTRTQSVNLQTPMDSPLHGHRDVNYRVFTQSGDAVVVTSYFINGAASLRAGQASAVQRLALANAVRWLGSGVRQ